MRTGSPLLRQWLMLKLLSGNRESATVAALAQELEVSEKTVRRDLITLRDAGFPINEQVGPFGRKSWQLDAAWPKRELRFTFDEALALYISRRMLEPLTGTLLWDAARRALKKIRATLGDSALRYVDKMGAAFHATNTGASDYSLKSRIIDQLLIGIEDRRATFITYQSAQATEPVTYDVYPYGIVYHRGSLYLIGYAPRHDEIRHWKVDRMEDAEITQIRFQTLANFNLREHMKDSFGVYHGAGNVRVRVRFDRAVARYVKESVWHPSQRLTPEADGGLIAEFDLSDTAEIKSWISSFGRRAEVLAPAALRRDVIADLQAQLALYKKPSPGKAKSAPR